MNIPPMTVTLPMEAVDLILRGLGKLPLEESLPAYSSLIQARGQHLQAIAEAAKPKRKKEAGSGGH